MSVGALGLDPFGYSIDNLLSNWLTRPGSSKVEPLVLYCQAPVQAQKRKNKRVGVGKYLLGRCLKS